MLQPLNFRALGAATLLALVVLGAGLAQAEVIDKHEDIARSREGQSRRRQDDFRDQVRRLPQG